MYNFNLDINYCLIKNYFFMLDFINDKNDTRRAYFVDSKLGRTSCCSLRRMRLMRQHDLAKLFEGNPIDRYIYCRERDFHRRGVYCSYNFVDYRCVPFFKHPHDVWNVRRCGERDFSGKVLAVADDKRDGYQGLRHLLVELAPNVLAFAETQEICQVGQTVTFYFYKYNSKTKKIYGVV